MTRKIVMLITVILNLAGCSRDSPFVQNLIDLRTAPEVKNARLTYCTEDERRHAPYPLLMNISPECRCAYDYDALDGINQCLGAVALANRQKEEAQQRYRESPQGRADQERKSKVESAYPRCESTIRNYITSHKKVNIFTGDDEVTYSVKSMQPFSPQNLFFSENFCDSFLHTRVGHDNLCIVIMAFIEQKGESTVPPSSVHTFACVVNGSGRILGLVERVPTNVPRPFPLMHY